MTNSERWTRREALRVVGGTAVGGTLVSGASDITTGQSDESWPQLGYDDANTGHAPQNTGPVADIKPQWSYKETTYGGVKPPAVVDSTVYIASGNNVYALAAEDGTELWAYETGNFVSSPVVADETVYVGSRDNNVYALDTEAGTEQWTYETYEERGGVKGAVHSTPAVIDGTVYVGSLENKVHALDAEDGTEKWTAVAGGDHFSSPAVTSDMIYVGVTIYGEAPEDTLGRVYALDAEDGTEQWTYETDSQISSPAVLNGNVYVTVFGGNVYTLAAGDGTEQWSYDTGRRVTSPTVTDGAVYVGDVGGRIHALDAEDGTERWIYQVDPPRNEQISPPSVANDTVYVGNRDKNVYALNSEDGTEMWAYETGNFVSSPAVVDGTVYVGTRDSTLYALTGKTSTLGTTAETTVPETIEAAQQQGTSATNLTSTPDDRETEISVFSFFSDSTVPAVILGGATTILGLGSVYAAYRRFQSNTDNQDD